MYKDLEVNLLNAVDRVLVDDYDLPAVLPTFYKVTGKTSPVVDFRSNMILKVNHFDGMIDEIFGKECEKRLVYEVIENNRLQRVITINDILFSLVYSLGDTDKAREKRNKSQLEYGTPIVFEEDSEVAFLVEVEDKEKLSTKREEYQYIVRMTVVYSQEDSENMEKFLDQYDRLKYAEIKVKSENSIFTIGANQSGLQLLRHKMDTDTYQQDILESNYNDNFKEAYDKLTEFLGEKNSSGLALLKGKPGTGKSSLLIHLTTLAEKLNVRFVFVPSSFTHVLSEPSFLTFAVSSLKNTVLILEDAEDALVTRGSGSSSAVTNILNISDGILGKILNIKILATINKEESIDEALKRKGRMKLNYDFDHLTVNKANALLKKLGIDKTVNKATSLADVYNIESDPNVGESTISRKKVGF